LRDGGSKIGKNPMKKSILAAMTLTFATFGASAQVVITTSTIAAGGITAGDAAGYPATVSSSGSYKLGENIQSGSSGNFIEITGNDVTLDLNGFSVLTSNSCSKTGHPTGNTCVGSVPTAQILVKITGSRVTVSVSAMRTSLAAVHRRSPSDPGEERSPRSTRERGGSCGATGRGAGSRPPPARSGRAPSARSPQTGATRSS